VEEKMSDEKILLIEDDHDNMGLIHFILEREGFSVSEAYDGHTGMNLARQEQPDLILLDLAMPEIDGWTVAGILKSDPVTQNIPIVALTVRSLSEDRKRAFDAGCNGYITKPMGVTFFTEEIKKYLQGVV